MIAAIALLLGGLASWMLRIAFVVLVPARHLPARIRGALDDVGPAVMAAIVASHLADGAGPAGLWSPSLVGVAGASLVAWWVDNLALTVLAGIGAMAALAVL